MFYSETLGTNLIIVDVAAYHAEQKAEEIQGERKHSSIFRIRIMVNVQREQGTLGIPICNTPLPSESKLFLQTFESISQEQQYLMYASSYLKSNYQILYEYPNFKLLTNKIVCNFQSLAAQLITRRKENLSLKRNLLLDYSLQFYWKVVQFKRFVNSYVSPSALQHLTSKTYTFKIAFVPCHCFTYLFR